MIISEKLSASEIKVIAFDLDGTLTQHKSRLSPENRRLLDELSESFKLLMVGAGRCRRIFDQMEHYPIDIIGNYGMQLCEYDTDTRDLRKVFDACLPCDKKSVGERVTLLRERHGYTEFAGDNVEYHASGCVTFPMLGTAARLEDKLAFDPDRKKRGLIYRDVCEVFGDYGVFIGGSSSFDLVPFPYNKSHALDEYCRAKGLEHKNVLYVGDDYGPGGNDEDVYLSDFRFARVDDYRLVGDVIKSLWA